MLSALPPLLEVTTNIFLDVISKPTLMKICIAGDLFVDIDKTAWDRCPPVLLSSVRYQSCSNSLVEHEASKGSWQ